MPILDRSGDGRTIETERWVAPTREPIAPRRSDEFVSDRFLVPTRLPMSPRSAGNFANEETFAERYLPELREPLGLRSIGRSIDLSQSVGSGSSGSAPVSPDGGSGLPSSPPSGDWLDNYLGNYIASLFGGEIGTDNQQNVPRLSSVPVVSGQGSSTGLILILLAGAGFAVYWFYFRKKRSVSDGD